MSGTGGALCGHCGRPMQAGVWIGGRMYHYECTHGPGGPLRYEPMPSASGALPAPALAEADVRRIVREEIAAHLMRWTDPKCYCATCDRAVNLLPSRMAICPECGDKRCPRAEDHRNACSKTPNDSLSRQGG